VSGRGRTENPVSEIVSAEPRDPFHDDVDQGWIRWASIRQRPRVVVVVDEPITKRGAARALRKWGYDTDVAASVEDAWPLMTADGRPLIAIVDWLLPVENGLSLCRRLRAATCERPVYVLLVTARHGADDAAMAVAAGADDLLAKPFDLTELKDRVGIANEMLYLECALSQ
jgi:DNA-binding response OmpR family regulator